MSRLLIVAACAASLALGGCANQGHEVLPTGVSTTSASWTNDGLSKDDLLYVTNSDNEVTVYNYVSRALVGVLTGFKQPMGECVDSSGDVYVTDSTAQEIFEYAHGKSKRIKTLNDAPDSPYACAVDPTTGNLAVANDDGSSQEGNIAIWPNGSGEPVTYTDSTLYEFITCAYDSSGNLFVTNGNHGYPYEASFAWLPKNGTKLVNIDVPGPKPGSVWEYVASIQWDGKAFVLGDYDLYRISLLHGQAYYVGEIGLSFGEDQDPAGPFGFYNEKPGSQATQVVGGVSGDSGSHVDYWSYPAGGDPTAEISQGVDHPFGVAISLAKN
jgi:hypothetical protein